MASCFSTIWYKRVEGVKSIPEGEGGISDFRKPKCKQVTSHDVKKNPRMYPYHMPGHCSDKMFKDPSLSDAVFDIVVSCQSLEQLECFGDDRFGLIPSGLATYSIFIF